MKAYENFKVMVVNGRNISESLLNQIMEVVDNSMYPISKSELKRKLVNVFQSQVLLIVEVYGNNIGKVKGFAITNYMYCTQYIDLMVFDPEIRKMGLSYKLIKKIIEMENTDWIIINKSVYGSVRLENKLRKFGKEYSNEELTTRWKDSIISSLNENNLMYVEI